ncbi:hypothetical protein [Mucilaginibacter sp. HD30]
MNEQSYFSSLALYMFIAFIAGIVVTRLIFSIPRFLRYQRAQIKLLELMAKRQGVDEAPISQIIKDSIEWEMIRDYGQDPKA